MLRARMMAVMGGKKRQTYYEKVRLILPANQFCYYPHDEAAGAISAVDYSGQTNHGVYRNDAGVLNGVTLAQAGIGDGRTAVLFDGANGYCNIHSAALASDFNGQEGGFSFWFKPRAASVFTDSTVRFLFRLRMDNNNYINVYSSGSSSLVAEYKAGGTYKSVTQAAYSSAAWANGVVIWSKTGGYFKFFLAGSQVGETQSGVGSWSGTLAATSAVIGAAATTPVNVWDGLIAHSVGWNTPPSDVQAASLAVVPL